MTIRRPPTAAELTELYGPPDDISEDTTSCTNRDRVDFALDAVNGFARRVYHRPEEQTVELDTLADDGDTDDLDLAEEVLGDLFCDLMHLCVFIGGDPDDFIERGRHHFLCEVGRGYDIHAQDHRLLEAIEDEVLGDDSKD